MKKILSFLTVFAVLLLSLSANSTSAFEAAEGYMAPHINITTAGDSTFSTGSLKGQFVLLTFWNSTAPESRIKLNLYSAATRNTQRLNIVAINFDQDEALYREIVRRDGLAGYINIHVDGDEAATIIESYNLPASGAGSSFLIDGNGRIVAIDPTPAEVAAAVG